MVPLAQLLDNQSLFGQVLFILFTLHLNPHRFRNVRYQPCNHTSNNKTQMLAVDGRCGLAAPAPAWATQLGSAAVTSKVTMEPEHMASSWSGQAAMLVPECSVSEGAKCSRY